MNTHYAERKLAEQIAQLGREREGSVHHARITGRVEATLDLIRHANHAFRLGHEQADTLKAHGIDVRAVE